MEYCEDPTGSHLGVVSIHNPLMPVRSAHVSPLRSKTSLHNGRQQTCTASLLLLVEVLTHFPDKSPNISSCLLSKPSGLLQLNPPDVFMGDRQLCQVCQWLIWSVFHQAAVLLPGWFASTLATNPFKAVCPSHTWLFLCHSSH